MARYLFTCHDAGGTVPPVLATAKALLDRGHRVTILSQPSVRDRATLLGCDFLAFSELADYRRDLALEEQLERSIAALVGTSTGTDLVAAAGTTGAEVLVVDPNLAGALAAAEALELPSAVLLHSLFRTFVDVWFGDLWGLLAEPINGTRRRFDVEPAGSWAEMLTRHDVLVSPVPTMFDAPVSAPPQALHHVGFLVPPADCGALLELPPGDEPLVVVSFSTTYQHQEQVIADTLSQLADEEVRVVLTTSGYWSSDDAPSNAVVAPFIPHVELFRHADLVITHGGLGTTAAALQAGVPLLCLPIGRDQPLNAARVSELGAGIAHPPESGAAGLRRSLRQVLSSPSYREAAGRIAVQSRDIGEAATAATALERLLDPGA